MVKVIDLSPEEIAREERLSKLAKMAKEVVPHVKQVRAWGGYYIDLDFGDTGRSEISVRLNANTINVNSPKYFDDAMKLAKSYERFEEPEFTLKCNYRKFC